MHAQRVAAELELPPELRELGTEAADMASRAIAAGLLREGGNRRCRPVKEQAPRRKGAPPERSDHLVAMLILVMSPFPPLPRLFQLFGGYRMHQPAGLTCPSTC